MILMLILPAWILALAVVGGLCVAAGRGDSALLLQHSDAQSSELVARGLHVIGSAARDYRRGHPATAGHAEERESGHLDRVGVAQG